MLNELFLASALLLSNPSLTANSLSLTSDECQIMTDVASNIDTQLNSSVMSVNDSPFTTYTFNYNGTLISSGSGALYYDGGNTLANCYCTYLEINIVSLLNTETPPVGEYDLFFNIPGNYIYTNTPYYIDDFNSNNHFYTQAYNSALQIEYHSDSSSGLTISDGKLRFVIYHLTASPAMEYIYGNNITYDVYGTFKDVNYGGDSASSFTTMDVYMPEDSSEESLPVIMTIHGGDWSIESGDCPSTCGFHDKSYFDYLETGTNPLCGEFIHININYDLNSSSNSVTCQQMLEDIDQALVYVDNHYSKADMSRLCLWGYSAGGHLAMLYSLNSTLLGFNTTYAPKMLISEGGPYDLTDSSGDWLNVQRNYGPNWTFGTIMGKLLGENHDISNYSELSSISPEQSHSRSNLNCYFVLAYSSHDYLVSNTGLSDFKAAIGLNSSNSNTLTETQLTSVTGHSLYRNINVSSVYYPLFRSHL